MFGLRAERTGLRWLAHRRTSPNNTLKFKNQPFKPLGKHRSEPALDRGDLEIREHNERTDPKSRM